MHGLARWCFRKRWIVLAIWIVALVAVSGIANAVGTNYSNSFTLPATDSTRAITLLQEVSPQQSGDKEQVVLEAKTGTVDDPAVRAQVGTLLTKVKALPHVTSIVSPYDAAGAAQVSKDRTIAFATVTLDVLAQDLSTTQDKAFVKTVQDNGGSQVQAEVSGLVASQAAQQQGSFSFLIGLVAAAIVLFLVFGSLLAMLLPLLSAIVSIGIATALLGLLTHAMKIPQFSSELVLLVGLGVGIDYALFIVSRHRQGLLAGRDVESSVITALATSGRSVLFAAITVCIALMGMFALGVSFLYGVALATSIAVLLTMLASLTLLPAMLGFLGPKVLSRRVRRRLADGHLEAPDRGTRWARWADTVSARPAVVGAAALAVVVVIALPFFSLRLGSSDAGNDKKGTSTREAYDLLARGFGPGFNGPLQVTAELHGAGDTAVLDRIATAAAKEPDVAGVARPVVIPGQGRQVGLVTIYPRSAPQDKATSDLVSALRSRVVPPAVAGTSVVAYVGGNTAIFEDFAHVLSAKLPLFIGIVVVLSYLVLLLLFRSLLVPLVASVMNLLSVAAAFGVMVAVFQWGWLADLVGVSRTGPIESFLPVMVFAILFGLSTDYEVFLVSRIHEEWLRTGDNRLAVRNGLAVTGKTITAAASIMFLVFAAFVLGDERVIKEFGLGFAAAVAIDALIVRTALVPAITLMLGRRNWWLPGWLDRALPHVAVEAEAEDETAVAATPEPAVTRG